MPPGHEPGIPPAGGLTARAGTGNYQRGSGPTPLGAAKPNLRGSLYGSTRLALLECRRQEEIFRQFVGETEGCTNPKE